MRRIATLVAFALWTTMLVSAQDGAKGTEMYGVICDQKCIKQDAEKASCDLSCTEKSGDAVFLDDQGKVWKVANPAVCKGKMGKRVKIHGEKMRDSENVMFLHDVIYANAG